MLFPETKEKTVVIFDLDGTITPSKSPVDSEMSQLLERLIEKKYVAIISGGPWKQFEKQLLSHLDIPREKLSNLILCPTSGSSMFQFEDGEMRNIYRQDLTAEEKQKILDAFEYALPKGGYEKPAQTYGETIEDRGSQISFSALGQEAPLEIKSRWDPDKSKRLKIVPFLKEKIPEFEARVGGTSTIDITRKGIDKAYCIRKISERLNIPIEKMVFVGDALFEGGNDEAARASGIECLAVRDPEETKTLIRELTIE